MTALVYGLAVAGAAVIAFPGHAGRRWPLLGWRLVARNGERAHQ